MGITTHTLILTLRRIDKLEAGRRRVTRSLDRCIPGSALAGELARQRDELDVQLTHLRGVVKAAEASGFKIWSRQDFSRGDFVRYRGVWWEVLRVNARSVTVPHPHAPGRSGYAERVVRRDDRTPDWTWTIGYHDGITGRMDPRRVADEPPEWQRPKDHRE